MSKEERLGRALLKLYGFIVKTPDEVVKQMKKNRVSNLVIACFDTKSKFVAKPVGSGVYWIDGATYRFDSWDRLLFRKAGSYTLNDHVIVQADIWKSCEARLPYLLKYKSLDELDILLTLAGCNPSPHEKSI